MKVAIFESGNYWDVSDIVRVFSSTEKAIENIPPEFKEIESFSKYYYEDKVNEKWLVIKEYKVEE